jgi:hypothetical protein
MLKVRLYVGPVKTPVLHIVFQLLIRGDSCPTEHLTKYAGRGAVTELVFGFGLGRGRTGKIESTGDERWGQFNKNGATVERLEKWTVISGQGTEKARRVNSGREKLNSFGELNSW